jgi:cell division protein FtsA
VNVSGRHIVSLNSTSVTAITRSSRRIAYEDIDRAVEQAKIIVLPPDREIIQCFPRSFQVDGQVGILHPLGMFGNRVELACHLVTGNYSHLHNLYAVVNAVGINNCSCVSSSSASAEAILQPDEKKKGVMLVDIGAGATDIAIFKNRTICYSAVAASGGDQITDDIASAFNISWADAQKIKIEFRTDGEPISGYDHSVLGDIILSRAKLLLSAVRAELIKSGCFNLLPAGVVLCGQGAKLDGICAAANDMLEMPIRTGAYMPGMAAEVTVPESGFETAVGLTLYAAGDRRRFPVIQESMIKSGMKHIQSVFRRIQGWDV